MIRLYALLNRLTTRKQRKGFTFLEVIIALGLSTVFFGIVLYFLIANKDSISISNTQISLHQDLRRCLLKMTDELSESTINKISDLNDNSLNLIQRDVDNSCVKCLPSSEECVYYTIRFKTPTGRNANGEINSWSSDIIYTLSPNQITRQDAIATTVLVDNITLVTRTAGNGYANDPNSFGSGFERLASNRIKISLAAERQSLTKRSVRLKIGTIVYLRN
ncbi:MAG: prepilin-type N-terminal cleavage/methylation domain-containing protein [Candidatus Omnitrophica bacterium]|nr:prepilin-type N-terminal cleavage/methylation domain-containing protein [Candidatus Omnitrophota bacterium]